MAGADREWPFPTSGYSAAYKNLPLNPDHAIACVVTLRRPVSGKLYGFLPRALLFGSTAAVLRYNGYSRIAAVLANILFGLPIAKYFDDCGFPTPSSFSADGLSLLRQFCGRIGVTPRTQRPSLGKLFLFPDWGVSFRARPSECD